MTLKILVVSPYFPPIINGPSIHVYHLVNGLVARGVQVRLHTLRSDFSGRIFHNGSRPGNSDVSAFRRLFDIRSSSNEQPISLLYITSTIKACDEFDIVHVHDFPKVCNDLMVLFLKKLRPKKTTIFTLHGAGAPLPADKFFSKIYWSLGMPKKVLQIVDHVITVNPLQTKLFAKVLNIDKITMIPEAVPSYYFVNEPTFVNNGKLKILFIGRMIEEKGIKDLLSAIHQIMLIEDYGKRIQLAFLGPDYGYLKEILRITDRLRLNQVVKILGPLSESEKLEYLNQCDILVLPSYYEAFGLPIVEAMARGKATIATETVGAKWLVKHGETGFLVKIGDPSSIANGILRFLEDPHLKYSMGKKALKHAMKFHMENMIEEHIRLYKNLLKYN